MNIKTQAEDWLAEAGVGVDRLLGRYTWDALIAAFVIVSLFALYAVARWASSSSWPRVSTSSRVRSPASSWASRAFWAA